MGSAGADLGLIWGQQGLPLDPKGPQGLGQNLEHPLRRCEGDVSPDRDTCGETRSLSVCSETQLV